MRIVILLLLLSSTIVAQPFEFGLIGDEGKEMLIDFIPPNYISFLVIPDAKSFEKGETQIYNHSIFTYKYEPEQVNCVGSFCLKKIVRSSPYDFSNQETLGSHLKEVLARLSIPRLDLRKKYTAHSNKYSNPKALYAQTYLDILGYRHFNTWEKVQSAFHQEGGEQEDNIFKQNTFMFSGEQLPTNLFKHYHKDLLDMVWLTCKQWAQKHQDCFLSKSSHNIFSQFFPFGQVLRYRALELRLEKSRNITLPAGDYGFSVNAFALENHLEKTRSLKYNWCKPFISQKSLQDFPPNTNYMAKDSVLPVPWYADEKEKEIARCWMGFVPALQGSLFHANSRAEYYTDAELLSGNKRDQIYRNNRLDVYFGEFVFNTYTPKKRANQRILRHEPHQALYRQSFYYNNYLIPPLLEQPNKVFKDLEAYLLEDGVLDRLGQDGKQDSKPMIDWEDLQKSVAVYQNQDYLLILHSDSTYFLSYLPCDAHPYHPSWDYETYYLSYGRYQKNEKGIELQSWTQEKLSELNPQAFYEHYAQHHFVKEMNLAYQTWSRDAVKSFQLPSLRLADKDSSLTEEDLFQQLTGHNPYNTYFVGSPASLSVIEARKAIFTAQFQHLQDSQQTWLHLVDILDLKGHLFHEEGQKRRNLNEAERSFYAPHYALRVKTKLREQALVVNKKTGEVRAEELAPWSPPAHRPMSYGSSTRAKHQMEELISEGIVPKLPQYSQEELVLGDFNPSMAQQIRHYFVPINQHQLYFDAADNLVGLSFPGGPEQHKKPTSTWLYKGYLPVFPDLGKEAVLCHRWRRFHEMGRGGYAFYELYKGSLAPAQR